MLGNVLIPLFLVSHLGVYDAYGGGCSQWLNDASKLRRLEPILEMNREVVQNNRFVTSRSLLNYEREVGEEFVAHLKSLSAESHWIDVGAGAGLAQMEYQYTRRYPNPAQTTGIVVKKTLMGRVLRGIIYNPRSRYLQTSIEKAEEEFSIPRADLMTDVYGAFAYGDQAGEVLKAEISLLKIGGRLYIEPGSGFVRIEEPSGNRREMGDWLAEFGRGIKVIQTEALKRRLGALIIERTEEAVEIPEIVLKDFWFDRPPHRIYTHLFQ